MDYLKRGGIQKEYEKTSTTFTKKGMWPDRYRNEMNGLMLATKHGITVPKVLNHTLTDDGGGIVTMRRIYLPRVDQAVWGNPQPELFTKIGSILASIHEISIKDRLSLALLKRRFQDLQEDILRLSKIRFAVVNAAANTMRVIFQKVGESKPVFMHGDYTIQNMFNGDKLIVFDWEHSGSGSYLYDIGVSLSFMILLVTDGAWTFADYYQAIKYFLDGYSANRKLTKKDLQIIDSFRFLGHRQVSQYYLFVLEYLAIIEEVELVKEILSYQIKLKSEVLYDKLYDLNICFDRTWFYKIVSAIKQGGYQISQDFWTWFKEEVNFK